jgi:hypothetical protein
MRRRAPRAGHATFLLALILGAAGCHRRPANPAASPSVVALVGERPVAWEDVALYVRKATDEDPKNVSPRVASSLLDQYLEELLLERAVEDAAPPVKGDSAAERRRELIARSAGLDALGDDELRREYEARRARYRRPAVIRVSQLFFRNREAADGALRKLQAGMPWMEVSRTVSEAPNGASGGSLGLVARGDLPADFEKVLWNLPAGRTTAVIAAPHGFHVFRVEERFEERDVSFEEAKSALRLALAEEKSSKAAADLVAAARRRHPVSVIEEHLPFPYVGTNARVAGPRP